ncbi:unnamed protein product [Durusdinium trenchii]|uniref:Uncharacterized protein n=1 Tax=Durusdinium trenchii TaxID=1381693 RepID=A0ABP0H7E4_9DINO
MSWQGYYEDGWKSANPQRWKNKDKKQPKKKDEGFLIYGYDGKKVKVDEPVSKGQSSQSSLESSLREENTKLKRAMQFVMEKISEKDKVPEEYTELVKISPRELLKQKQRELNEERKSLNRLSKAKENLEKEESRWESWKERMDRGFLQEQKRHAEALAGLKEEIKNIEQEGDDEATMVSDSDDDSKATIKKQFKEIQEGLVGLTAYTAELEAKNVEEAKEEDPFKNLKSTIAPLPETCQAIVLNTINANIKDYPSKAEVNRLIKDVMVANGLNPQMPGMEELQDIYGKSPSRPRALCPFGARAGPYEKQEKPLSPLHGGKQVQNLFKRVLFFRILHRMSNLFTGISSMVNMPLGLVGIMPFLQMGDSAKKAFGWSGMKRIFVLLKFLQRALQERMTTILSLHRAASLLRAVTLLFVELTNHVLRNSVAQAKSFLIVETTKVILSNLTLVKRMVILLALLNLLLIGADLKVRYHTHPPPPFRFVPMPKIVSHGLPKRQFDVDGIGG